ncbi:MAG TPA: glycoside hydrolase family 97 N-terminal domain-containing protein, partial [Puia sp.]|nr:glycoside hydrolase family 97 N-terminal domain-containing protein [Puia sp.]
MSIVHCLLLLLTGTLLQAQSGMYRLLSPDHKLAIEIATGEEVMWSVMNLNTQVLLPSGIGLELSTGEVLGRYAVVRKSKKISVNKTFATPLYKKSSVTDQYNELTLTFAGNYGLIFRAYNDGVAYRFFTRRKSILTIRNEKATFQFASDHSGLFPVIPEYRIPGDPFMSGFEALYRKTSVSALTKDTLSFLPVLINLDEGKKLAILEADLEDYPGMFLQPQTGAVNSLQAVFAGYPKKESLYRNK